MGPVTITNMTIEENRLHGFSKVFWETMEETERETVELLFDVIPDKHTIAFDCWKHAMITVFAESAKERIAFMVEELHKAEVKQ